MSKTTIIGKNSFMAKALKENSIGDDWLWLSHHEAMEQSDWLDKTNCVINFSYAAEMRSEKYNIDLDIDTKIAQRIKNKSIHYVMLSSRMVYGDVGDSYDLSENMVPKPQNVYGSNKYEIENSLTDILGDDRVTILRLSNIFGFEPERRSFFGMALTKLSRENSITYDMNPFVKRDFLSVWRFGEALSTISDTRIGGLYNLGSGFGIETGLIAEWLIEGYGSGSLIVTDMRRSDIFWLNMKKTEKTFNIPVISTSDIKQDCVLCGSLMKNYYNR